MGAGMDNPKVIEVEVDHGAMHRSGDRWRFVEFGFDAIASTALYEEKV